MYLALRVVKEPFQARPDCSIVIRVRMDSPASSILHQLVKDTPQNRLGSCAKRGNGWRFGSNWSE